MCALPGHTTPAVMRFCVSVLWLYFKFCFILSGSRGLQGRLWRQGEREMSVIGTHDV